MRYPVLSIALPAILASLAVSGAALPARSSAAAQPGDAESRARPGDAAAGQQEESDIALVLGLRPEQRAAVHALMAADAPPMPPRRPDEMAGEPRGGPPSFAQELARREATDAAHAQQDRSRVATMRAFYAQLDARQQQVFEALWRLRHHAGGHPGGPDGPGGHRGPGDDGPPPPPK